jgi:hypothetical protein
MKAMSATVGSKRPIPVFSPAARDLPDGNVVEDGVVYIPLTRAAKLVGHKYVYGMYRAISRKRIPLCALRQKVLPDGCRLFISQEAAEEYKATRAFRRGRPRKSA